MNDCSSDQTLQLKKKFKQVNIITNKKRLGYEKNILKGLRILLKKNNDFIITFDADGEHHTKNLKKIKKYINKNQNIDLLVGKRSSFNRISEKIVSILFKFKFKIEDPLSGLKVYKSKSLKKIIPIIKTNYFLADFVSNYYNSKKIMKNINVQSVKINKRKSKVGIPFFANIKILKTIGLLFY